MSRRPALVTQADVARAIRAAKQAGAGRVDIRGDTISIHLAPASAQEKIDPGVEELPEVVL